MHTHQMEHSQTESVDYIFKLLKFTQFQARKKPVHNIFLHFSCGIKRRFKFHALTYYIQCVSLIAYITSLQVSGKRIGW